MSLITCPSGISEPYALDNLTLPWLLPLLHFLSLNALTGVGTWVFHMHLVTYPSTNMHPSIEVTMPIPRYVPTLLNVPIKLYLLYLCGKYKVRKVPYQPWTSKNPPGHLGTGLHLTMRGWRAGGAILRYVVLRYLRTIAAELPGTSELAMERAICLFRYIAPVWPIWLYLSQFSTETSLPPLSPSSPPNPPRPTLNCRLWSHSWRACQACGVLPFQLVATGDNALYP